MTDVQRLLDWLASQGSVNRKRLAVAGVGQAGVVALLAAALLPDQVASAAVLDAPASLVTDEPYPPGARMGLLAPGLFHAGDLPHAAALLAPRRLVFSGPTSLSGQALTGDALASAFRYPRAVFSLLGAADRLTVAAALSPAEVAAAL